MGWGAVGSPSAPLHCGLPAPGLCPLSALLLAWDHLPGAPACPPASLRPLPTPHGQSGHETYCSLPSSLRWPGQCLSPSWGLGGPSTQRPLKDPETGQPRPRGCSPLTCEPQESP